MRFARRLARPPYRLFSLLLQYPSSEIRDAGRELLPAGLPASVARALEEFLDRLAATPLLALQQEYVRTFDLEKGAGLYLTHYSEGDTRKRGAALVELKRAYAAAGFRMESVELPDFLPVMLEFAELEPEAGRKLLVERRAGLEMLRLTLARRESPYERVVAALLAYLPALAVPDREAVERFLRDGAPTEAVGLEPFTPAGAMPSAEPPR